MPINLFAHFSRPHFFLWHLQPIAEIPIRRSHMLHVTSSLAGCHMGITGQVHQDKGGRGVPQEAEDYCPEAEVRGECHSIELATVVCLNLELLRCLI